VPVPKKKVEEEKKQNPEEATPAGEEKPEVAEPEKKVDKEVIPVTPLPTEVVTPDEVIAVDDK
jgi:hypothetical protein